MYTTIIFTSILIFFLGIIYGFLFHAGKKHLLYFPNPFLGILFTLARFLFLICLSFYIIKFIDYNPILLITLFVSSYLSTVAVLTYKA
jgi:hypothetical protein